MDSTIFYQRKGKLWSRKENISISALILGLWMYKETIKDGEQDKEVIRISPRVGLQPKPKSTIFNKYGTIINNSLRQDHIFVERDGTYEFTLEQRSNILYLNLKYPGSSTAVELCYTENDISSLHNTIPNIEIFSIQDKNYYLKDLYHRIKRDSCYWRYIKNTR